VEKKLYRDPADKKIAGVCSGFAAYIDIDPTVVRVIWALLALSGTGLVAYLICALIIPEKPADIIDV
jgi:phage shock protein PspC (stress-responsive transcriptional regulator)